MGPATPSAYIFHPSFFILRLTEIGGVLANILDEKRLLS
jgi:hypothetical protein